MFIPGIFIWGDALGEAAGIGMSCMCGVGDGVGEAVGICFDGICFVGVGDGDSFGAGVGVGIGIPCLCCACKKGAHSRIRATAVHQKLRLNIPTSNLGNGYLLGAGRDLKLASRPVKKREADYVPLFLSFMLHESPQQQHSCLSADELAVAPFVLAAPSFISHESPQQHSCLSDDVAWFFMPSFFII